MSADNFNLRSPLKRNIENFVTDAAEGRHVHRSAVDHDQSFVAESSVEGANADRPTAGGNLADLHAWNHAEESGMPVAPELWMSSSVITKMAAVL